LTSPIATIFPYTTLFRSVNNADGDNPLNLKEGTYNITVTNSVTSCAAVGQASLLQTTTPIVVVNATVTDRFICAPDGSIVVNNGDGTRTRLNSSHDEN